MRTLATVLIATLAAAPLAGQVVHTRVAGSSAGTVAGVAPAPPVIVVPGSPGYPGFANGMGYYTNLPVVVLPDGRVYADFGRGYERVVRTCNSPVSYVVSPPVSVGQPTVTQPVVSQPAVVVSQPLPYTPPVPNQQTASQQMLNPQALAIQSTLVNRQSCWGANGRGQVYITHP